MILTPAERHAWDAAIRAMLAFPSFAPTNRGPSASHPDSARVVVKPARSERDSEVSRMSFRQRIHDYLHEREIRRLSACQIEARQAGDKAKERHFDAARMQAIRERSAGQWARIAAQAEKRMGVR